ncbi:GGDEF domain-containing protein [Planococcus beigongshangi]|uniref:GGDEF domain-containing protein n=1 Tax=Planococcus beigongshangi TaxID=2782536 RepID=UPI00193C1A6E|nr:diguanylate cyclase [Planococcus beigongshangi]
MEDLLFFFLENMALIIALMYLGFKVKDAVFHDWTDPVRQRLIISVFIGFLTFSIMYHPFIIEEMRLDLREVPLFFISYVGGWQYGLLSAILPTGFRMYIGGPTMLDGILQSILLPIIIGSLFHDRKRKDHFTGILDIKRMMIAFVIYEAIKSVWVITSTPMTLGITLPMFIAAAVAVISMGLILNGENRSKLLREELEFYSNRDPMTQLPNIRFFKNNVRKLVENNKPMAIVMLDVDYFKVYNDTHGHQKGDAVLRSIAQILTDLIRKEDFVARYGGEEFICCITAPAGLEEAAKMAERIRKNIFDYHFDGEELQPEGVLTVSMGMGYSSGGTVLEEMIEEADQSLYQSKRQGRNRLTVFPGIMLDSNNKGSKMKEANYE